MPARRSFLIAENLRHADACATIDRSWRRTGSGRWTDEAGGVVEYICEERHLLGMDRGSILYLGWGWSQHRWLTPELIRARGFITHVMDAR